MFLQQFKKRITTSTTTTVINQPCSLTYIYIAVANPGSSWKFKIQDKASPAFVLVPEVTLAAQGLPDWKPEKYDEPIFMEGGVDVVTTGGTAGEVGVVINAWVNQ